MTILERIEREYVEALKAHREELVSTLRLVRSSAKNRQIELQRPLTDDEAVALLRTMVKQYRDSLADFASSGREDLAEKSRAEIAILESYLPPLLSEAELETACRAIIERENATSKEAGRMMGLVMKELGARADGALVRTIVQRLLSERQT